MQTSVEEQVTEVGKPTFFVARMDTESVLAQIRSLADPLLAARQIESVELRCHRQGAQRVIRLLVHAPGGVTLDQCAELHRALSAALEQADLLKEPYLLEIASPGLDRPLTTQRDFERVTGELITADVREPVLGQHHFEGQVVSADPTTVTLETRRWGAVTLPFANIAHAVVKLRW